MLALRWKPVGLTLASLIMLFPLPIRAATIITTRREVLTLLNSPFQKTLFQNTYESLFHRVAPDGYLPESLTGAYPGMFPRSASAFVFMMLEKHQWETAKKVLRYVLQATRLSHLQWVPHVIGPANISVSPLIDSANPGQILHTIVLYNLKAPNFGGAQPFQALSGKLYGVDLWLSGQAQGKIQVEVVRSPTDRHPLAVSIISASLLSQQGGWMRMQFQKPVTLQKGATYDLRVRLQGHGSADWWGLNNVSKNPYGGCYSYDKPPLGWRFHSNYLTAFALNYGTLQYKRATVIPVISNSDQPDGQYSIVLAWARYITDTHDSAFENATYDQVARLADLAIGPPYLNIDTSLTTDLVRNPCFEHSREGRFWDTYDLLTQVFTAEAWRKMIPIAKARGDVWHVQKWQNALNELQYGIRNYLTRRLHGKLIYAEMRLPDGYGGKIYQGLSWVNLSPIAARWGGVNPNILRQTVAGYRKCATFLWDGYRILGCEWNPPGIRHIYTINKSGWTIVRKPISHARISHALIGKQWAWAFLYAIQQKQWGRACHMLQFLKQAYKTPVLLATFPKANPWPVFAECFWFRPDGKVAISDPGNGEQCSWYCWAIIAARKILMARNAMANRHKHDIH